MVGWAVVVVLALTVAVVVIFATSLTGVLAVVLVLVELVVLMLVAVVFAKLVALLPNAVINVEKLLNGVLLKSVLMFGNKLVCSCLNLIL